MLIAARNWFLKEKPVIHSLRGIEDAAHAQLLGAPTLSSLRAERLSELTRLCGTTMSIDSRVHSMSYSRESPEVSRFGTANACGEALP
jgi:hypothetical protein